MATLLQGYLGKTVDGTNCLKKKKKFGILAIYANVSYNPKHNILCVVHIPAKTNDFSGAILNL